MASPVGDSYACASGGVIAGGRYYWPAWLPAVGEINDISLNTLYDVRGGDAHTMLQMDVWSGAAFAESHGRYGALLFHSGGHVTNDSNAVYSLDIESRLFVQERPRAAQFVHADGYIGDTVTGWMWSATDGDGVQVGEPFAAHTYSFLTWIPPGEISGSGGASGYLYTPGRGSMSQPGQRETLQPHKYAVGSFSPWTFAGSPLAIRAVHSFAFYDKSRRRVVYGYGDYPYRKLYWADPENDTNGDVNWPSGDPTIQPYYHTGFHAETDDLYLSVRCGGEGLALSVVDPVAGRHYKPTTAGTAPSPMKEMGVEWVETWRALVFFNAESNTVWTLKAPTNPRTGVWSWSSQALTGTVRPSGDTPPYTKFQYVPRLQLFVWPTVHNAPVQGFRISAP